MNAPELCPSRADDETARRWTAATLPAAEAAAFEAHLLGCDRCQGAVQHAAAMSRSLRDAAALPAPANATGDIADGNGAGIHRWRSLRWIAPVAVAAGLTMVALTRRPPASGLDGLGTAPAFVPATVRAPSDARAVDRAMAAYVAGRYGEAARLLEQGIAADASAGAWFFLGVSRLFAGDAQGAVPALGVAAADGASPYRAEAAYWLAKAWLRQRRPDEALAHLRDAARAGAPGISPRAAALADSIERIRRR